MMTRSRPIVMPDWAGKPVESDMGGWPVIDRFDPAEKGYGAGITDLTHRPKAILYGLALQDFGKLAPGQAAWTGQGFVSLVKPGEGVLFDISGPMEMSLPGGATDMTDAWVLLSVWGPKAVEALSRLFALDLACPAARDPFYFVTRWHALVVQGLNLKGREPGFLLATDRSHGQNLFDGLIHGGEHLGIKPVGLGPWLQWFEASFLSPGS